jgi:hypothetical protein
MAETTNTTPERPPPAVPKPRFGRFTLRELFILTGLVAVAAGLYTWARIEPTYAAPLFIAAFIATIAYLLHVTTRRSPVEIIAMMTVLLPFGCLLIMPSVRMPRAVVWRMQCSNHLKQIGLALQNYHDQYGSFPPAYIRDAKGKPMHSWRVLILPFIEQRQLYEKYRFDEPWDGPNNSKLHNEIVSVFCCPSRSDKQPRTETSYVVVVGSQTLWPGTKATKLSDVTDGTSNTIMAVEVANSGIHWMEPRDLHIVQMPLAINPPRGQGISSYHPNTAWAVFADGHTAALRTDTPPKTLHALLTAAGGEQIGDY